MHSDGQGPKRGYSHCMTGKAATVVVMVGKYVVDAVIMQNNAVVKEAITFNSSDSETRSPTQARSTKSRCT